MKFKKQVIGAAAGCLLIGTSNVMALDENLFVDVWSYGGVQSSSGTVEDTLAAEPYLLDAADFCMQGVSALRAEGFEFIDSMLVEPRRNALYFQKSNDAAVLFCVLRRVAPTP